MIAIKEHAEGIAKEVTTTQQKAVRVAADNIRAVASAPAGEIYTRGVDGVREVITHNLKAMKKMGDSILRRITAIEGVPEQTQRVSKSFQKLTQEVVDAQNDLVNNACDVMAKFDPAQAGSRITQVLDDPVKAIKETVDKTLEFEKQVVKTLAGKKPAPAKKAPGTAKRPPSKAKAKAKAKAKSTPRKTSSKKPAGKKKATA